MSTRSHAHTRSTINKQDIKLAERTYGADEYDGGVGARDDVADTHAGFADGADAYVDAHDHADVDTGVDARGIGMMREGNGVISMTGTSADGIGTVSMTTMMITRRSSRRHAPYMATMI